MGLRRERGLLIQANPFIGIKMLQFSAKILKGYLKTVEGVDKQLTGAVLTGLRKEGYRIYKETKDGLISGNLGLRNRVTYKNKLIIGKRKRDKRFKRQVSASKPLLRLHQGVLYKVDKERLKVRIGFLGEGWKMTNWRNLALDHADGYSFNPSKNYRNSLHRRGIHLRKSTMSIKVPRRWIMGAVMQGNKNDKIAYNVKRQFELRMKGYAGYKS